MSDKSEELTSKQKLDAARVEMDGILEEIKKIRVQAEEQLKSAEANRKKADEDATAITQLKAKIEEQLNATEASRKKSDEESLLYAGQIKAKVDEQLKTAEAIRKKAEEDTSSTTQTKSKIDDLLKSVELAKQKADSEALFAFNAKKTCEEHSTAIAQLKGAVEANVNSISTNKQKADELAALITANKPVIEGDIKKIDDSRKEIEEAAIEIKDAAEKGINRLRDIETSKGSANTLLEEVEVSRDAAAEARKKAENAQTQADDLFKKITTAYETSKTSSEQIAATLEAAKVEDASLTEIVARLTKSNEITKGFETELTTLTKEAERLLPGFADVSLASAFGLRKGRFLIPKIAWIATFILCIAGLICIAYPSFKDATSNVSTLHEKEWGDIWRVFVMRLPIVLPLVWLAIYAGRNYMLSIRLEEDYAYKEAVSKSFAGYKREMEKFASGQTPGPDNPLTILCVNVLKAIAEHPGRIYDGKHYDINILTETKGVTDKIAELSQKKLATK